MHATFFFLFRAASNRLQDLISPPVSHYRKCQLRRRPFAIGIGRFAVGTDYADGSRQRIGPLRRL